MFSTYEEEPARITARTIFESAFDGKAAFANNCRVFMKKNLF